MFCLSFFLPLLYSQIRTGRAALRTVAAEMEVNLHDLQALALAEFVRHFHHLGRLKFDNAAALQAGEVIMRPVSLDGFEMAVVLSKLVFVHQANLFQECQGAIDGRQTDPCVTFPGTLKMVSASRCSWLSSKISSTSCRWRVSLRPWLRIASIKSRLRAIVVACPLQMIETSGAQLLLIIILIINYNRRELEPQVTNVTMIKTISA